MLKKITLLLFILVIVGVFFVLAEKYLPGTGLFPDILTSGRISGWGNACLRTIIVLGIALIAASSLTTSQVTGKDHVKLKPATVYCYIHLLDAQMAKLKLELEGIGAYLTDEHTIWLYPLWSLAIGGVKVNVRQEDSERAMEILGTPAPAREVKENQADKLTDSTGLACPECNSHDTYHERALTFLEEKVLFYLFGHPFF